MKSSNIILLPCALSIALPMMAKEQPSRPNVVVILTDDQGYEDLGCYNSPNIKTPNIDKLASEGLMLTSFYMAASVSSASRAALLTGRLNTHNGVKGVYFPDGGGLQPQEITMAEAFKSCGYTTACFGKWHLGDLEQFLPTAQGFDKYFGIPYSNDMFIGANQKFSPDVLFREGYTLEQAKADQEYVASTKDNAARKKRLNNASPLMEQNLIVEYPCDQATLTQRYFDRAIDFVEQCGDSPFFLYITPSMPHYPIFVSEPFQGKSAGGLYGDAVEEIDHNVGRFLDYLESSGVGDNTIVIFTSDNGPWLGMKSQAGSAGELRDGKFSHYEGGVRVPFILRWTGVVPAGAVSDEISTSIDLFPTLLGYVGYNYATQSMPIDGVDVSAFWAEPTTQIRKEYLYVRDGKLFGIRQGDWIYLPQSGLRNPPSDVAPELYNIKEDIGQKKNLYEENPAKVEELKAALE